MTSGLQGAQACQSAAFPGEGRSEPSLTPLFLKGQLLPESWSQVWVNLTLSSHSESEPRAVEKVEGGARQVCVGAS